MRELADWINERTGFNKIWMALFERHIPEAKGPGAWLYALGSASLFVFAIQAVTGALLAMSYAPTPDHAHDSVRFISEQMLFGKVVRGLHHWGASFMVVLVVLHFMRVYFSGAYKYPREATWITGVVLLLLVLFFSFTGYLLPWDQKAYWATAVGTNISGQTPVVGKYVSQALLGGPEMGAATLTRFYAFHVLFLPGLTVGLITVHLFLVVWHGITEPPRRREKAGAAP